MTNLGELLTEVGHDVTKLSSGDETVTILIEDLEGLLDLLLGVSVLHLAGHEVEELREVNGAGAIGIDLVDHVLELSLGRVLAEGAHDSSELLGGNGTIAILIEKGEGFLEFGNLFFGELIGGHL